MHVWDGRRDTLQPFLCFLLWLELHPTPPIHMLESYPPNLRMRPYSEIGESSYDDVTLESGGTSSNKTGVLMKRSDLDTDAHIESTLCEHEDSHRLPRSEAWHSSFL